MTRAGIISRGKNVRGSRGRLVAAGMAAALIAAGLSAVGAAPAFAVDVTPIEVRPRLNATRIDFQVGDRVNASVDVGTGNLLVLTTDLRVPGIGKAVQMGMAFNSLLLGSGSPLPVGAGGYGWTSRLGADVKLNLNSDGNVVYFGPDGVEGKYVSSGTSSYTTPTGFKNTLVKTGSTGWTLTDHDSGSVATFNASGRLDSVRDRNNQTTTLTYTGGKLTTLTSTRGGTNSKKVTLTPDSVGFISTMTQTNDTSGSRSVSYAYLGNQLRTITDAASRVTTFGYSAAMGDLTSISNTGGVSTTIAYDSSHRVTSVTRSNPGGTNATTRLSYPSSTQTLVASPNTNQGLPVTSVPRTTYTISSTKRVTSVVDPLSRTQSRTYTPFSDVASATSGGGGSTGTTHTANSGESLTGVTSPMGASASLSYTGTGTSQYLPTGVTDTQGNNGVLSYDGFGNPA